MRAYKFVTRDFAHKVASGSVRLPSTNEIREKEDAKAGFGDRSELANEAMIIGGSEEIPGDHPAIRGSFTFISGGKVTYPPMNVVGETMQTIQDALLYCCSLENTPELRERMLRALGADTVFEIADVEEFAQILSEHPQLAYRQLEAGPVKYLPVIKEASALELKPVDAFRKDTRFEWQKEYRLVWAGEVFQKSLILHEPRLSGLLKQLPS
jgi:hypothetical protein